MANKTLNIPRVFRTPSVDALLSWSENVFNTWRITSQGRSLTFDCPESMSSDSQTLFLKKAVKPLTCFVDVLDPEKILHPFDCVALSKVTY